jgi:hypothetical protein
LTLFTESTGKRFIGDVTDRFGPGHLLLIGPNLPHYMRNDVAYYQNQNDLQIRAIVIHFASDFVGAPFFEIEELRPVKKMLKLSNRGLHIYGNTATLIGSEMEKLIELDGFERLQGLLNILYKLSQSSEFDILASLGSQNTFNDMDVDRVNRIYNYLAVHF